MKYKTTIFSKKAFLKFKDAFVQSFGVLAMGLGMFDVLFPNTFGLKYYGLFFLSTTSLIWAIIKTLPKHRISREFLSPDTKIVVKVGDLFKEKTNLVIGMNDTFDTEKGKIIKPKSIQGQFLTKIYADDREKLDSDLSFALKKCHSERDAKKTQGKNLRYSIGTAITLSVGNKKYFCSAYSFMDNKLKAQSNISSLTESLDKLWKEIRATGAYEKVSMAVLGSDLARIGNASHSNLIKLIISSFILASREEKITNQLTIVIHENNLRKVNMFDVEDFLQNF